MSAVSNALGATQAEWFHFDMMLGLGQDLLPVVANQTAQISKDSCLKTLGKVPSRYNRRGEVSGFVDWGNHKATDTEIRTWSSQPDYGICVITREVRGIDVDVSDPVLAHEVESFITGYLGFTLPKRFRANSSRFLLAVRVVTDDPAYSKWVLSLRTTEEEAAGLKDQIEILLGGHQFIAAGTHSSGARIEWAGGLPCEIPEQTPQEFETLVDRLQARFGKQPLKGQGVARTKGATIDSTDLSRLARTKGPHIAIADPAAEILEKKGLVLGQDRDGKLLVACPWVDEHTQGEDGDGSTGYFPAGSNGYLSGSFKCLHGHCAHRTTSDFFATIGYEPPGTSAEGFTDVVEQVSTVLPAFARGQNGRVKPSKTNLIKALRAPAACGFRIQFDTFRGEILLAEQGATEWRPLREEDYTRISMNLERWGFGDLSKDARREGVQFVAAENKSDSAQDWLNSLQWDGVPRVETFAQNYLGADDTAYHRAVGMYMWTALAGRVLAPGVKADMVPILVGAQGLRKSTSAKAICPHPDQFVEIDLGINDGDMARLLRGRMVAELGELRGMSVKDELAVNALITRTHESWIPKYQELAVNYPRRFLFIGTSNRRDFLRDPTGSRRWLPLDVGECDPEKIANDRDQLWAEGSMLFKQQGVVYGEAERLARGEHEKFADQDSWQPAIAEWLHSPDAFTGEFPTFVTAAQILTGAIGLPIAQQTPQAQARVRNVMEKLGIKGENKRVGGGRSRGYSIAPLEH